MICAKSLRLKSKEENHNGGGKEKIFYWGKKTSRGRERKEIASKTSLFDLRSSIGRNLSGQEVHLLDEGYAWVPKIWDFAKDSRKDFGKSKVSGLGNVHKTSYSFFDAPRDRNSSYFCLFSVLRAVWLCFFP